MLTARFQQRVDVGSVVEGIRDHWPSARVRSRTERSPDEDSPLVFEMLTEKQSRALRAATLAGFFDRPQRANATDVAALLDVSRSTLLHHLRTAERKVFESAFDAGREI